MHREVEENVDLVFVDGCRDILAQIFEGKVLPMVNVILLQIFDKGIVFGRFPQAVEVHIKALAVKAHQKFRRKEAHDRLVERRCDIADTQLRMMMMMRMMRKFRHVFAELVVGQMALAQERIARVREIVQREEVVAVILALLAVRHAQRMHQRLPKSIGCLFHLQKLEIACPEPLIGAPELAGLEDALFHEKEQAVKRELRLVRPEELRHRLELLVHRDVIDAIVFDHDDTSCCVSSYFFQIAV